MQEDSDYWMADYSTTKEERQTPEEIEARRLRLKNNSKSNGVKSQEVNPRITQDTIKKNRIAIEIEQYKQRAARQARIIQRHVEKQQQLEELQQLEVQLRREQQRLEERQQQEQQRIEAMTAQQTCPPKTKRHSKRINSEFARRKQTNENDSAIAEAYKSAIIKRKKKVTLQIDNSNAFVKSEVPRVRRIAVSTESGMQIIDMTTGEVVKMQDLTTERLNLRDAQLAEKCVNSFPRKQHQGTNSELYNYLLATNTSRTKIHNQKSRTINKLSVTRSSSETKSKGLSTENEARQFPTSEHKNSRNLESGVDAKPKFEHSNTYDTHPFASTSFLTLEQFLNLNPAYTNDMYIVRKANWEFEQRNIALEAKEVAQVMEKKAERAKENAIADTIKFNKSLVTSEQIEAECDREAKAARDKEKAIADAIMINKSLAIRAQVEAERDRKTQSKAIVATGTWPKVPQAKTESLVKTWAKNQMVAEVEARLKKQEGMKPHELAEAQIRARAQARAKAQAKMLLSKILWIISLFGLLLLVIQYFSDGNNTVTDKALNFSDFPVEAVYVGKPAKLVRDSELANNYRTRLSAALSTAPVFAGEYSQAFWGCGQECSITVFVNKRTGKVINQTFGGLSGVNLVDFKLDSGLIKAHGPLFDKKGSKTKQSAMYYFQLENEQLKLIQTAQIE